MVVSKSCIVKWRNGMATSGDGRLILRAANVLGNRPDLSINRASSLKLGKSETDHNKRQMPVVLNKIKHMRISTDNSIDTDRDVTCWIGEVQPF